MDVNFVNAYSEVLTENFDAVIKQNMLLQARLKLNDKEAERFKDTSIQLEELQKEKQELLDKVELLNATVVRTENVRYKANETDSLAVEKSRIQQALNESMREVENLKQEVDSKAKQYKETIKSKDKEISELQEYVKTLEELLPASKLKKVNPTAAKVQPVVTKEEIKATEQPQIEELNKTIVQSGGTF